MYKSEKLRYKDYLFRDVICVVWTFGQGITGITIVNPKGESYDIDGFGLIVSTKEEDSDADRT